MIKCIKVSLNLTELPVFFQTNILYYDGHCCNLCKFMFSLFKKCKILHTKF